MNNEKNKTPRTPIETKIENKFRKAIKDSLKKAMKIRKNTNFFDKKTYMPTIQEENSSKISRSYSEESLYNASSKASNSSDKTVKTSNVKDKYKEYLHKLLGKKTQNLNELERAVIAGHNKAIKEQPHPDPKEQPSRRSKPYQDNLDINGITEPSEFRGELGPNAQTEPLKKLPVVGTTNRSRTNRVKFFSTRGRSSENENTRTKNTPPINIS